MLSVSGHRYLLHSAKRTHCCLPLDILMQFVTGEQNQRDYYKFRKGHVVYQKIVFRVIFLILFNAH